MGRGHAVDAQKKPRTVFALQEVLELRGELVAVLLQCLLKLVFVDGVVMILVESAECALPGLCSHC
jgi:hypothetical protein